MEIERHPLEPFLPANARPFADAGKFSTSKEKVVDGVLLPELEQ